MGKLEAFFALRCEYVAMSTTIPSFISRNELLACVTKKAIKCVELERTRNDQCANLVLLAFVWGVFRAVTQTWTPAGLHMKGMYWVLSRAILWCWN